MHAVDDGELDEEALSQTRDIQNVTHLAHSECRSIVTSMPDLDIAQTALQLGAILRDRRKRAGLTQAELAEAAHVSRAFLIGLENGKRPGAELGRVLAVLRALDAGLRVAEVAPRNARSFDDVLADLLGGNEPTADR
jgi:DNA-binding XRE family transcriptional regulator